jgi:hypothetical protein
MAEALNRPSVSGAEKRRERTMGGNFTIGRFGGIEVRLHLSLIVVFALIVWSLADYLGIAVVAALLFLASILLHELGHSWLARREGIEVDSITLWLFGGVAEFKDRFTSAGAEFRVALSGPLVSIGLGVVFVLIALANLPTAVDVVAAWLGYINLSTPARSARRTLTRSGARKAGLFTETSLRPRLLGSKPGRPRRNRTSSGHTLVTAPSRGFPRP